MKTFILLPLLLCLTLHQVSHATQDILSMLDEASDLTPQEKDLLQPIFKELQKQYDFVINNDGQNGKSLDAGSLIEFEHTQREFELYFENVLKNTRTNFVSDTLPSLPSLEELVYLPTANLTEEEKRDYVDMQNVLKDLLGDTISGIKDVKSALYGGESTLIEIDKPKVVAYLYNALKKAFYAYSRASRAAYCTYSQIPELNTSLSHVNDAVDCTKYTISLIETIKSEIAFTLQTIDKYIQDLEKILKTIAGKDSTISKLVSLIRNIDNMKKDIQSIADTLKAAKESFADIPNAANVTKQCTSDFINALPQILDTLSTLTTCIVFEDEITHDYEFMKPESEEENDFN